MNEEIEIWKDVQLESLFGEEWRDMVGWEKLYLVSNLGRVKSMRTIKNVRSKNNGSIVMKVIRQCKNKHGYLTAGMKSKDMPREVRMVHILVMRAFSENPENKRTINHINGNKQDNRLSNLEWATHGENHLHAYDTGLKVHGEKHAAAKVKDVDIPRIFEMRKSGMLQWQIGEVVGCDRRQVGKILNGQRRIRCVKEYVNNEL